MFKRALQTTCPVQYVQFNGSSSFNQCNQLLKNRLVKHQLGNQNRQFIKRFLGDDKKTNLKLFGISFLSGIALITYYDYKKENGHIFKIKTTNKDWDHIQRKVNDDLNTDSLVGNFLDDKILDNLKITKKFDGKNKLPGINRVILLRYRNCPFCCKVKTFLDYYDIEHEIVEVNPLTRKQIKFSNYRKVPILLLEDDQIRKEKGQVIQLNDSSSIISVIGTYLFCNPNQSESIVSIIKKYESLQYVDRENKRRKEISNKYFLLFGESISPNEFKKIEDDLLNERKFRKWTDEKFVHVLSPNIYRTVSESVQAFNYFSEVSDWENIFSSFERLSVIYIGSYAMYLLSKYLKKKYNLKEDVRMSLYDHSNYFLKSKGKNEFMGGKTPNLSDLSVYGALSSIEGCEAFRDLTENTKIGAWYFKMKKAVDERRGSALVKV